MVKRALLATLVGGLLLLGAPSSALAAKAERHSESKNSDRDSNNNNNNNNNDDESDHDFRFWDEFWHPGFYYSGFYPGYSDCGYSPFYRFHRHHGFFGFDGDDESNGNDDENGRSLIFLGGCGYRDSCYDGGFYGRDRYFGYYGAPYFGSDYYGSDCGGYGYRGDGYGAGGYGSPARYGVARSLVAVMSSAQEVPAVTGSPMAGGTAYVDLDAANGRVCYSLTPYGISQPTGAHIHRGAAGTAGPVVVDLKLVGTGAWTCVGSDAAAIQEIAANPGDFYVNVHSVDYPNGVIRGQLEARH